MRLVKPRGKYGFASCGMRALLSASFPSTNHSGSSSLTRILLCSSSSLETTSEPSFASVNVCEGAGRGELWSPLLSSCRSFSSVVRVAWTRCAELRHCRLLCIPSMMITPREPIVSVGRPRSFTNSAAMDSVVKAETEKQLHLSSDEDHQLNDGAGYYISSCDRQEPDEYKTSTDLTDWELDNNNAVGIRANSQILNEVLTALNETDGTDDLIVKLRPFEGKIFFRDAATIMKLLNEKRLCYSFYMWMKQQANFAPDLRSFLTVIRILLLTQKWEKLIHITQDVFDFGFALDNGTYCRIIKEASLSSKITVCEWWFQKMKERGCRPDQTSYNTMIHAYALARLPDKSFSTFEEMKEMGIDPDINTFCHLLSACQKTGDAESAHKFFQQIESHGLKPDLVSYSILIDTYGKEGKAAEAAELFKEMQNVGITPDAKTYNSLVYAYGKSSMVDQATSTFYEYQKVAGQNPDKVVFWTMLHLYSRAGQMKEALAVKRMMRVAKLTVDVSCYINIIDGFRRLERWEDAARAFKEMQRYKYPITESTYHLMLKIYSKAGHHVECERIFDQIMVKGYRDKFDAYEIMINIYRMTNNITNASRIYEQMNRNNCLPNRNICNMMIHIYAKAGMLPACEKIVKEMGTTGIKPNGNTFLTLIKAYAVYGEYYSAVDAYETMRALGLEPDYALSELMVEVFLKTGHVGKAEKFLKEIVAAGINPNKRMVSAVVRAGGVVELSKPLAVPRPEGP